MMFYENFWKVVINRFTKPSFPYCICVHLRPSVVQISHLKESFEGGFIQDLDAEFFGFV